MAPTFATNPTNTAAPSSTPTLTRDVGRSPLGKPRYAATSDPAAGRPEGMRRLPRIALVGGGLGGLTAAIALGRAGFEAHVFEQADRLREIGAGIGLSPNALKVLRALGVEGEVRRRGSIPDAIVGRDWTTARQLFRIPLKGVVEARFGAANVQIHRGDLLNILATVIP